MTTILHSETGNVLLASYATGNPFEIDAGTVILAHSGVAIYGNASQVFTLSNAGSVYGYNDGIALNLGGTITNSGTISSDFTALNIAGGAGNVVNSGSLIGRSGVAVVMTAGGTLNNEAGGTITGAFLGSSGSDAVFITGATGTVVNDGAITQSAKSGQLRNGVLLNAGGALTNHATGTITAGTFGVEIRNAIGTVINSGSIGGALVGVGLYKGGGVTNLSGAISGAAGIYVTGATGTISNGATITGSTGAGVYLKAGGRVSNLGTAAKTSGAGDGVQIAGGSGTVQNSGSITGSLGGVVLSGGGYVNNVGAASMLSGGAVGVGVGGGAGTVSNAATITATGTAGVGVEFYDSAGVFSNTVVNSGTIAGGSSGEAVLFGAGDDRLVIDPGAVFTGAVDGGGGTNTLELAKTAFSGSFGGLGHPAFANFQRVNVDTGAAWTFTGSSVLLTGVTLTNRGDLTLGGAALFFGATTNYGTISGTMTISSLGTAGPLINEAGATIASAGDALYGSFKAWSLTNAGTIISGGTDAIYLASAGGVIINQGVGLISGAYDGVYLKQGGSLTNNDATSTIVGAFDGVVSYGQQPTSVTNFGSIGGTQNGVLIRSGATAPCVVTNQGTGATISGAYGVFVFSPATTVVNSGSIVGKYLSQTEQGIGLEVLGGAIVNQQSGVITGDAVGVVVGRTGYAAYPATLTNAGSINGAKSVGVVAYISLTADNKAGGLISGGTYGIYLGGGGEITNEGNGVIIGGQGGIVLKAGGTVDNLGATATISGGLVGVVGASAVTNAGVIYGASAGVNLNSGTVTNEAGGTIAGAAGSLDGLFIGTGTVTNAGSITGVDLYSGGLLTNQAGGAVDGVWFQDGVGKAVNAGTIRGAAFGVSFGWYEPTYGGLITHTGAGTVLNSGLIQASQKGKDGVEFLGAFSNTVINAGTIIGGPSGKAVRFAGGDDLLVLDPGATFFGGVDGGGGADTLELAQGAGAGVLSGLGVTFTNFQTVIVDPGAAWTLSGANTLSAGQLLADDGALAIVGTLTNGGVINANGGGVITLTGKILGAGTVSVLNTFGGGVIDIANASVAQVQGALINAGTIAVASTTSLTDLRILAGGATLSGGGTVTMSGSTARILGVSTATKLTNVDNTIAGTGFIGLDQLTLINEAAGVIDASTKGSLVVKTTAAALTNAGLMEATGGGLLVITQTTVNNVGGTIEAASGSLVDLSDDVIEGGTLGMAGGGAINVNVAGGELDGSAHAVTLGGLVQLLAGKTLILDGAIANTGRLNTFAYSSTADLIVGAAGATLSGKGSVNLSNSLGNRIYGQAASDVLTNVDNHIDGAGQLGNGTLTLVNQAAGQIVGNQNLALTIDTGANTIQNAGLIENVGKGGTLVKSAVNNTGILQEATAGTLTLAGLVTGTGVAKVSGGTLYVVGAFAENVTFTGTTGVLKLGDSQAYSGKITALSKTGTNWLDLADIGYFSTQTKATFSGTTSSGTLTVTDGTHTAKITLLGNYTASTFTVSSDGHGGTKVVDPAPATASFIAAMAGFEPPTGTAAVSAGIWRGTVAALAAPKPHQR